MVVPVFRDNRIVAILGVANKPTYYNQADIETVSYLADVAWEIVEKKRLDEEVERSNQQVNTIFESISDAFFALDDSLVVTYFNNAAEKMLSCKASDVLGKPLFDSFPEARDSIFEVEYSKAIKEKKYKNFEVYFPVKPYDNWYDVRVYPQENGISVYFQVITERKKNEIKLQEKEEYLRTILQTTTDGFWVVGSNRRMLDVNQAYLMMVGYTREEFLKLTINDIDAEENPGATAQRIERIIINGSEVFETRHRHRDGSIFDVEVSATFLKNNGDQFVCFCRNITERKKAEKRVNLLANMLDNAPGAISVHDMEGNFLYTNYKNLEYHGYTHDELMAINLHGLDVPESEEKIKERIEIIKKHGEASFEVEHFRKDGSRIPLLVYVKKVDWYGKPALFSIGTDLTERKLFEESLLASEANLRSLNEEYVELNDELKQSNRKLQKLMNDLSESHSRNSALVAANPDFMFVYSRDGVFLDYHTPNPEALLLKPEEFLYKNASDVLPDFLAKINQKVIDALFKTGKPQKYSYSLEIEGKTFYFDARMVKYGKDKALAIVRDITEQKLAELALIQSQELLNQTQQMAKIGGWEWDVLNQTMKWTDEVYHIHEMNPESIPHLSPEHINISLKCYDEEKRHLIIDAFQRSVERGEPYDIEVPFTTIKGKKLWVRTAGKPKFDGDLVVKVTGHIMDITEIKQVEEDLRQSEHRFQLSMEATRDGLWDWNVKTREAYYSPAYYTMLGYEVGGFATSSSAWKKLVHPDDWDRVNEVNYKCVNGLSETIDMEFRMKSYNGEWKWIYSRGRAVERDKNGIALRIVGTHVDITERKNVENEILKRELLLNKIFDVIPIGLWFADEKGKLLRGNPAGIKIWGAEPTVPFEEYGVFKARRLPSGEEIAPADWALAHTITKGATITDELIEIDAFDGKKRIILNYTAPVLDNEGNMLGAIVVNNDVTKLNEAERHNRLLASILERSQDFIGVADVNQKAIFVNKAGQEMLSLDGEETVKATRIEEYFLPEDLPFVRDTIIPTLHKEGRWAGEFRFRHFKTGRPIPVLYELFKTVNTDTGKVTNISTVSRDISQIKQAEKALRESEKRYRKLYEETPVMLHSIDKEGRIISVSNTWLQKLGYTKDEVIGKKSIDFLTEESKRMAVEVYLPEFFKKGFSKDAYYQMVTKDGKVLDVLMSAVAEQSDSKGFVRSMAVIVDITERKQAEKALRQSEERFRGLYENATVGIYRTTPEGRILMANPTLVKMLGYDSFEELAQRDLTQDGYEPDYKRENFINIIEEKGEVKALESEWKRKDGTAIFVSESARVVRDNVGKHLYYEGIVEDITERRRAIDALRASEERISSIFRVAPTGIGVVKDRVIIEVNPRLCVMTGYNAEELIGQSARILYPSQEEFEFVGKEKYRQISDKGTGTVETKWLKKNGSVIDVLLSSTPIVQNVISQGVTFTALDITRRKQMEITLKNSEKKFRLLFENMTQGFALHEVITNEKGKAIDYRYLDINPAFERLTGLKANDLMGRTILEVMPNTEKYWIDTYGRVSETGESIRYENYSRELGKYYDVSAFSPQMGLFAVVFSDVTERKRAEEKVQILSKGIEQSPAIVVITDINGNIEYVNQRFTEVTGYSIGEAIGLNPRILKSGLQSNDFYEELWSTILSGQDWKGEMVNKRKNGETYWESAIISPIMNENGEIVHFIAIKEDITEDKRIQLELEKQHRLINTMLDNLPIGIFMVDAKTGRPLITNEHAKKLLGKGIVQEATTETLANVYNAYKTGTNQLYPTEELPIVKGMKGISSYVDDMEVLQPDGTRILLEVFGCPVQNDKGGIWASLIGFIDITERKKAELALTQSEHSLKEKNEEYLAVNEELAESYEKIHSINKELVIAREKAVESDRLKTAFLANMSHEIRTPMNAIIGFSELLLNPSTPSERREFFTRILNTSCHHLLSIVDDVIDIAKIETGQMEIHEGIININEVISRIQNIFSPQAAQNNVTIKTTFSLPNGLADIVTDSSKLNQILNNLVGNAVKFTEKGYIEVGYKLMGEKIEFYVSDTGIGIRPEHHGKIFERFQQVEMDSNRKYGGTGLGLPICKALVEMLGGSIWLTSEFEKGTTFYFSIPYNPLVGKTSVPISTQEKSTSLEGITILVAEDEDANFIYLNEVLQGAGAEVIHATNGVEAIDFFRSIQGIDIILMDIKMPKMDGISTTRAIRTLNARIPIVALTAYALSGDREKCLAAGCNSYISKPILKEELLRVVASMVWANR